MDPLSYNEFGFTRLVKCYNCSIPHSHTVLTVSGNNILAGTGDKRTVGDMANVKPKGGKKNIQIKKSIMCQMELAK